MYSTLEGAKKRAKELKSVLREIGIDVQLHQCLFAMARGRGFRDWDHLSRALPNGQLASLRGFVERASLAMPPEAVGPTHRWVESAISALDDKGFKPDRETRDWYAKTYEFVFAIGVIHRGATPLLRPGSGRGQRLRQDMVCYLCLGPYYPQLDRGSLELSFEGERSELFRETFEHPNFGREFDRLVKAEILRWSGGALGRGRLVLRPPPVELVWKHVQLCRRLDAEYWLMDAEFNGHLP